MTTAPLLITLLLATVPSAAEPGPASAGGGPAILDFHADWCPPCREMRPRIELLSENGYPVRSIDVDEHPELANRYKIEDVPTFVIVDAEGREVARRKGIVEAGELASLLRAANGPSPVTDSQTTQVIAASSTDDGGRTNPDPWATVVRITVKDHGTLGYGSGTVIESSPEESIILTCAHIFHVKARQPQAAQFHKLYPVLVELFDGKLGGPGGQTVRPVGKPMPAEVIDYDFDRDVALVRIRPGRVVPSARVVPPHWKARERMAMYTVGCSQGKDATAWNTVILDPDSDFRVPGKAAYEAIECNESPKQGRLGGGLFTDDGHVAGVCNFAFDSSVRRGLYASPNSIYSILSRNGRSDLFAYQPNRRAKVLVADQDSAPATRPALNTDDVVLRGQSPDGEVVANRDARLLQVEPIIVPPPDFLDIRVPESASGSAAMNGRTAGNTAAVPATAARPHEPGRSAWIPVGPGGPSSSRPISESTGRGNGQSSPIPPASPAPSGRNWSGKPIGG